MQVSPVCEPQSPIKPVVPGILFSISSLISSYINIESLRIDGRFTMLNEMKKMDSILRSIEASSIQASLNGDVGYFISTQQRLNKLNSDFRLMLLKYLEAVENYGLMLAER